MKRLLAMCCGALVAACGTPAGSAPGNAAAAAAPATPALSYDAISYVMEGPGVNAKWRIARDGKGSFDESVSDVLGQGQHLSARIDAGPEGFTEIEQMLAGLPKGEVACDEYQESMVAMGWLTVKRERASQAVETRFNLNCIYHGAHSAPEDSATAADERMSRWAEQAPGHEGSLEMLHGDSAL